MLVGARTSCRDKKATPGIQTQEFKRTSAALTGFRRRWCIDVLGFGPLCAMFCVWHSPMEAWSSVPSRYKSVRIGHQEVSPSHLRCWGEAVVLWFDNWLVGGVPQRQHRNVMTCVSVNVHINHVVLSVLHSCPKYGQHSGWSRDSAGPVWKCEYWHSSVLLGAPLSL